MNLCILSVLVLSRDKNQTNEERIISFHEEFEEKFDFLFLKTVIHNMRWQVRNVQGTTEWYFLHIPKIFSQIDQIEVCKKNMCKTI